MIRRKQTNSLRRKKSKKGGIVLKNYDDLILMHYGVKGMKWRYHKNNGSTSLYAKRQAQMRYSGSSKGRPDSGDAESHKNSPLGKDPVGPNGNPEETRRKLVEQQKAKMQSRAAADRLRAIADRNIRSIGPRERKKPQPIDFIKPKESGLEEAFRKPGRDLKRKMAEYDNGGPNSNPENTRKKREKEAQKQINKQVNKAKSDAAAAKIKSASDKAIRSVGPKERQPIDAINKPKKSGIDNVFREPGRKLKKKTGIMYKGSKR